MFALIRVKRARDILSTQPKQTNCMKTKSFLVKEMSKCYLSQLRFITDEKEV